MDGAGAGERPDMISTGEKDLFGEDITQADPPPLMSGKRKPTVPNGYAAPPGSGPKGETCKSCDHYCRTGGHARTYLKCGLMEKVWTNGPGTDIKASSPACLHWKPEVPETKK